MPHAASTENTVERWVYHVCASDQRDSILSHGLDHAHGTSAYAGMDYVRGNYVFTDLDAANAYLHVREAEEADEYGLDAMAYDLFEIEADGLVLEPDQFADDESGLGVFSRLVRQPIDAGRIRLRL